MQKCKVCESESLEHLYIERLGENYYFCEVCELAFIDEDEIVSSEEEKHVYDQHNNTFESKGYVEMFENFLKKAVLPFVKIKGDSLDYGCGPGPVLAKMLENIGFNSKTYDPIFNSDADYDSRKYDLITSTEVFEHFKNPVEDFAKISKLLKKGGVLSIMTLLRPNTMEEFSNWWYTRDKTHISFYSPKTLYLLGKKNGLEMIYNDNKRLVTFKKL